MALVEWTNEYEIGIPIIDQQHRVLFNYVNHIAHAVESKSPRLSTVFAEFIEHARFHFQTEEQHFEQLSAKERTLHKLQHKHILEQLEQMLTQLDSVVERKAFNSLDFDLYGFLLEWFVDHVRHEDKKISSKKVSDAPSINKAASGFITF